jgi:phage repressor protein C with HTH and peptisase S24 domain
MIRCVAGESMLPAIAPGRVVWATSLYRRIRRGDVIIVTHDGLEKIKRVQNVRAGSVFVVGDNAASSTDSREFGWLADDHIVGRLLGQPLFAEAKIASESPFVM